MTPAELQNWIALYAATALCSTIAACLAMISVGRELIGERAWTRLFTPREAVLFVPRIWWRWQKRYLTAAPVTLAIVAGFALTLHW